MPQEKSPKKFFMTGGTGLIGLNLIPRLLHSSPNSTVTLLVRGNDEAEAAARTRRIAESLQRQWTIPGLPGRLLCIRGDVTLDDFGIERDVRERLMRETTHFIHGAATIRFDHPIGEARFINCRGTERALALAEQGLRDGPLQRFVYIGTSSVSGKRGGDIFEDELEMGQSFFNTYEQSKAESERLVRNSMSRIPTVIFRPSIVIGDSRTGWTPTFNVIYIPLRLFDRGMLAVLPASPDVTLDLVPVDWVTDVMVWIMGLAASEGKVCHITAGKHRSARLRDVIERAGRYFDACHPLPKPRTLEFVSPEEFGRRRAAVHGSERTLLDQLDTLLPYISVDRLFDSRTTDGLLRESAITFPRFSDYADAIFGYCVKTRWGKTEG